MLDCFTNLEGSASRDAAFANVRTGWRNTADAYSTRLAMSLYERCTVDARLEGGEPDVQCSERYAHVRMWECENVGM